MDVEPTNPFLINKLAQLYRRNDQSEEAVRIFRGAHPTRKDSRIFYHEWAACEGSAGNFALNVWLDSLSLSDQADRRRLGTDVAPVSLAGISFACHGLFDLYPHERTYIEGCGAAAQLGLGLQPISETQRNLESNKGKAKSHGVAERTCEEALDVVRRAFSLAWQYREAELPDWLPAHDQLEFTQLAALLGLNRK